MGLFSRKETVPQGKVVTVVDLKGAIMAGGGGGSPLGGGSSVINFDKLRTAIDKAFAPPGLVGVALDINCPGGSPTQSEMIGNYIREKAIEKGVPVYAFTQDVAASGGYWLACAADEIYAAGRTSLLGSIGVVTEYLAFKKAMDKVGIESRTYTAGTSKRRMGPYTDANEKDVAWLQDHLAEVHEMFKDWIKSRRGARLTKTGAELDNTVFNGDVWHAEKAQALGLIDGIGMMDSTLKHKFGADVKIHRVKQSEGGMLSRLFGAAASGQSVNMQAEQVAEALVDATRRAAKEEALWGPYNMR